MNNNRLQSVFETQKRASLEESYFSLKERHDNLEKLALLIAGNQQKICEAINTDFGNRCAQETRMLEISSLMGSVKFAQKRLKKWMKPQSRHVGITFFGAKNTVLPQPKGVVGIVTPWNYPLFLALSPCISAMAAGNRCIIKLAANSQNLCRLLDELVSEVFSAEVLSVIPGCSASEFSSLPWDHLVFTGSAETGKRVMAAAAKNLTPVTLELGGKSPTIIADDYDVKEAAKRILLSKYFNAGQTCVASDYVFIPQGKERAFAEAAKEVVQARFSDLAVHDYTSIIDEIAYQRLLMNLEDAQQKGAEVIQLLPGERANSESQKIAPHLVVNVSEDMLVMREEIFGPILPIKTYTSLDDVIGYVNHRERPLALYIFSNDIAVQEKIIYSTLSGGVCINDSALQVGQHDLPFGGIGNSGMGHYHGYEGFLEFTKLRPIFKQAKTSVMLKFAPPYTSSFDSIISFVIKFRL